MENVLKEKITGAWGLVSFEQEDENGLITYPLGENAKGSIYYLPDGHVSVHLMQVDRQEIIDPSIYQNKPLKYSEIGYLAYCGRFYIDSSGQIITHEIEIALYPDWVGGNQIRIIELEEEFLQLSSDGPVGEDKIQFRLLWKKAESC